MWPNWLKWRVKKYLERNFQFGKRHMLKGKYTNKLELKKIHHYAHTKNKKITEKFDVTQTLQVNSFTFPIKY